MTTVGVVVCPLARCGWVWRYDKTDPEAKKRARKEEQKHWNEFHEPDKNGRNTG